ncbi:hypothetical protein KY290_019665 [Solanum tuberosum]|uniref:Integrase core domain containing protein n=1 Tax=Solanum tuberosum TaxID=4113 RepID=A0ABQ7VHN2_SOLTU|nr:hypothetical protein KY284_018548 [Solanum tuberosum]KAH0701986.1 hypothetical protein KY285_016264 [Solanum tuberosum]KAH0763592.1 hypothetical protein KY290_019665 [Solanum tuberosum]
MSSNNGEGPSLHTGGSVAFVEYRRRHKELTGKELWNDELFLMTHKTKNEKKWICGKSERLWNTFTNTIKDKVGETSTLRNEEGLEVHDGDMERNTTTNGEDEGEKTSEDDVNLLKMNPSNIPTQQIFETPEFQKLLDRVLEQRMKNMQENVQMDIRENMEAQVTIAVRVDVARMLGFTL